MRRQVLQFGTAIALASFAGCTAAVDRFASQVLAEVNVLNQLNREVSGSITVTSSAGDTVLDRSFEAPSTEAEGESNVVAYDDIWEEAGEYEVRVALIDIVLEGTARASRTVRIEDTESEMVGVLVGTDVENEPIAIRVGESLSDFGEETEDE